MTNSSLSDIYKKSIFKFQVVNFYQFKDENPEFFDNVYPLDLREIGEANVIAVPPYRDQTGRRLLVYRIGKFEISLYFFLCFYERPLMKQRIRRVRALRIDKVNMTFGHIEFALPGTS